MSAVQVTYQIVTQNSSFLPQQQVRSLSVLFSAHPRRDGQAELAWVAYYTSDYHPRLTRLDVQERRGRAQSVVCSVITKRLWFSGAYVYVAV